jgi:protein tyrosine phosphatase
LVLEILEYIEDYPKKKILFHCKAGTGRTGTLIAIVNCMMMLNLEMRGSSCFNSKSNISVFSIVRRIREFRVLSVITLDQYQFIYKLIARYIQELHLDMSSSG